MAQTKKKWEVEEVIKMLESKGFEEITPEMLAKDRRLRQIVREMDQEMQEHLDSKPRKASSSRPRTRSRKTNFKVRTTR